MDGEEGSSDPSAREVLDLFSGAVRTCRQNGRALFVGERQFLGDSLQSVWQLYHLVDLPRGGGIK